MASRQRIQLAMGNDDDATRLGTLSSAAARALAEVRRRR